MRRRVTPGASSAVTISVCLAGVPGLWLAFRRVER
jgi:hypothetical protein